MKILLLIILVSLTISLSEGGRRSSKDKSSKDKKKKKEIPDDYIDLEEVTYYPPIMTSTQSTSTSSLPLDPIDISEPEFLTPLSSSSNNDKEIRPLIEDYIDRNLRVAKDFVRDLQRNQYEVALNVFNKAKPQIDSILHDISELLGENCRSRWSVTSTPHPSLTRTRFPCTVSEEDVQQKLESFNENIVTGSNYRVESHSLISKLQNETLKLHQTYAAALRTANVSSPSPLPQTEISKPKELSFLSDTPLESIDMSTLIVPILEEEETTTLKEDQLEDLLFEVFEDIESKNVADQIDHYQKQIREIKSEGPESSFKLFQLAGKIKNSKHKESLVPALQNRFPSIVQKIIWGEKSKLKIQVGNDTFRIVSMTNSTVIGLPLTMSDIALEEEEWKFIPEEDASSFALYNIERRMMMGCQLTKDNNNDTSSSDGSRKEGVIYMESMEERDISMFNPNLLWRPVLYCQRMMGVQDYVESLITKNVTGIDSYGMKGDEMKNQLRECPDESFLVSLVSVKFPDFALEVDTNGKVFPGESMNPGRFIVY